jgi:hypothetical protein
MQTRTAATTAAIFFVTLCLIVPVISADGTQEPAPAAPVPLNDTSLFSAAAHGPRAPLSSFEKQEEITLYRFELNQTTFPGPRSMAFGPRFIQLTTSPATLMIIGIGVVAGGAVLFVMFRQRKAKEMESDDSEEVSTEDGEKKENG